MRKPDFDPAFRRAGPRSPTGRSGFMRSNTTGYRLIVQREGRYRTAVDHATAKTGATVTHALSRPRCHRPDSFVLEGEAVLLGVEGIADFNGVHSRKLDDEVQ